MAKNLSDLKPKSIKEGLPEASLHVLDIAMTEIEAVRNLAEAKTSSWVRGCGDHTTVGGAAVEEIATRRAKPGMHPVIQLKVLGAVPVTVLTAVSQMGKIVVTFSADPADDHELSWVLFC